MTTQVQKLVDDARATLWLAFKADAQFQRENEDAIAAVIAEFDKERCRISGAAPLTTIDRNILACRIFARLFAGE
jgi:hypothetical protein